MSMFLDRRAGAMSALARSVLVVAVAVLAAPIMTAPAPRAVLPSPTGHTAPPTNLPLELAGKSPPTRLASAPSTSTFGIAGRLGLAGGVVDSLYDPVNGLVYVAVYSDLVVVRNLSVVATLILTSGGYLDYTSLWLDPLNGEVYAAWEPGISVSIVSIVNGTTFVGNVTVGGEASDIAFDTTNGWAYVANYYSDNVSVLSGNRLVATIPVGPDPNFAIYDPANGYVYVTCGYLNRTGTVDVLNGTSKIAIVFVGSGSGNPVWDPNNGLVYVPNSLSNNTTVIDGTRVEASLAVGTGPVLALYDASNGLVYVWSEVFGTLTILRNATVVSEVRVSGFGGLDLTNPVEGPDGSVYVADTSSNSVIVMNGTEVSARVQLSMANWGPVEWILMSVDPANGYVYAASFDAGFTADSNVSVIGGSTLLGTIEVPGDEAQAPLWDASGRLGYVFDAVWSKAYILNETTETVYPADFRETGLASGTEWSVAVGGTTAFSSGSSLTMFEPNGTYTYRVAATGGYTPRNSSGFMWVNGSATLQSLTFVPPSSSAFPSVIILVIAVTIAAVSGVFAAVLGRRR